MDWLAIISLSLLMVAVVAIFVRDCLSIAAGKDIDALRTRIKDLSAANRAAAIDFDERLKRLEVESNEPKASPVPAGFNLLMEQMASSDHTLASPQFGGPSVMLSHIESHLDNRRGSDTFTEPSIILTPMEVLRVETYDGVQEVTHRASPLASRNVRKSVNPPTTKEPRPSCGCWQCLTEWDERNPSAGLKAGEQPLATQFMIVCKTCGCKRCPHATDHRHTCTGSNEPGQPGSQFTKIAGVATPMEVLVPDKRAAPSPRSKSIREAR